MRKERFPKGKGGIRKTTTESEYERECGSSKLRSNLSRFVFIVEINGKTGTVQRIYKNIKNFKKPVDIMNSLGYNVSCVENDNHMRV